jgi:hypothetical protein
MDYFVVLAIIAILGTVAYNVIKMFAFENIKPDALPAVAKKLKTTILSIGAGLAIVFTLAMGFHQIESGRVGVVYQFGSIVG